MRTGVASRTAYAVAMRRAVHQILDRPPVFEDPIAIPIIGQADVSALVAAPQSGRSQLSRPLRAFVAVRSRHAENELETSFRQGVRQYVVLGAGLDTFAYRNPYRPGLHTSMLRVFEIDHPDTQAWKLKRLHAAAIEIPDGVTYIPVNFEKQSLGEALTDESNFNCTEPAFFSWLGVTPYLTMEAMTASLRAIAALPPESGVVFDYAVAPALLSLKERIGVAWLSHQVARLGEAFQLFLDPRKLEAMLREIGFPRVEDLGQIELNARYFAGRTDGLAIRTAAGRIVTARR